MTYYWLYNTLHVFMRYFRPSKLSNKLHIHIISSPFSPISEMNKVLSNLKRVVLNDILHFRCRDIEDITFLLENNSSNNSKSMASPFSKIRISLGFYVLNKMIYSGRKYIFILEKTTFSSQSWQIKIFDATHSKYNETSPFASLEHINVYGVLCK